MQYYNNIHKSIFWDSNFMVDYWCHVFVAFGVPFDTCSLVIVGMERAAQSKNYVPNKNLVRIEHFCCLNKENERFDVVPFSKYTLLTPDLKVAVFIVHFLWISANKQPKRLLFDGYRSFTKNSAKWILRFEFSKGIFGSKSRKIFLHIIFFK